MQRASRELEGGLLPGGTAGGEAFVFAVLPMVGSILLAYGIFQVVVESRQGHRKRVTDRLQGKGATQPEKSAESILRRHSIEECLDLSAPW